MNAGNARATYLIIRYAFLVAALLWVMLGGRHLFAGLHRIDVVILIVLLNLHAVMLRISVPFISAAGRRRKLEPGRLTIELPIVVTIITVYGGIAMAMVALLVRHATGKPLTISIGVSFAAIHDDTRSVLERADRALYEAKNRGRNRVVETA